MKKRPEKLSEKKKLWIASDLHLDVMEHFRRQENKLPIEFHVPDEVDIVILAGDICEGTAGITWADELGKPVLFVPGNHEYYRANLEETELALRKTAAASNNVVLLHNDRHDVGNVRFLGTTLWTDYRLEGNEQSAMSAAEACMADHRVISKLDGNRRRLFSARDAQKIHLRCREWLERQLTVPHDGPTVVITHHGPHVNSIHSMYLGTSPINGAFSSDLTEIIKAYDIDLWIHGHTHWTFDYELFGTRVVCNPYGYYPSSEINDFTDNLIVEVG